MDTATYSVDDNKLRLYPTGRLDTATFERVKALGFRWAPKQELFVAPKWTPARVDMLVELCGSIDDEDTTLVERTEERADRFGTYAENRQRDSEAAHAGVRAITDGIPFGQPILVGHHSEKRARRDVERIHAGMDRSVKMARTAAYWTSRAAGALRSAKYKQTPAVRARRIKRIESERRGVVRTYTPADNPPVVILQDRWHCVTCGAGFCREHPEAPVPHVWTKARRWTPEADLPGLESSGKRWLDHYDGRLTYERAMLAAAGGMALLENPKRPKQPPLLNYRAESLSSENEYHRGEVMTYPQSEMTKAEYARIHTDYKGTRLSLDKSHRFRIARTGGFEAGFGSVLLTDSKLHQEPKK